MLFGLVLSVPLVFRLQKQHTRPVGLYSPRIVDPHATDRPSGSNQLKLVIRTGNCTVTVQMIVD